MAHISYLYMLLYFYYIVFSLKWAMDVRSPGFCTHTNTIKHTLVCNHYNSIVYAEENIENTIIILLYQCVVNSQAKTHSRKNVVPVHTADWRVFIFALTCLTGGRCFPVIFTFRSRSGFQSDIMKTTIYFCPDIWWHHLVIQRLFIRHKYISFREYVSVGLMFLIYAVKMDYRIGFYCDSDTIWQFRPVQKKAKIMFFGFIRLLVFNNT